MIDCFLFVPVYAEAANKDLAREVAAQEFLQIVRQLDPYPKMPSYQIPEGLWYDQNMVEKLQLKLGELDLPPMRYETLLSRRDNHDYYTTTFYIGDDEFVGKKSIKSLWFQLCSEHGYNNLNSLMHCRSKFQPRILKVVCGESCVRNVHSGQAPKGKSPHRRTRDWEVREEGVVCCFRGLGLTENRMTFDF